MCHTIYPISLEVIDMYILKGFMVYSALADNTVGVIAPLGELSTDSLTFAKEKGQYKSSQYPDGVLYSFESRESSVGLVPVPQQQSDYALAVGQWVFEAGISGELDGSRTSCLQAFTAEFSTDLENFEVGEMITNGDIWMPSWVSYRIQGTDSYVKLWFADEAFSGQYDGFELEIIPPVENLDDLFGTRAQVQALLAQRTIRDLIQITEQERQEHPYTVLRTDEFAWVDRFDTGDPKWETPTYWTVLIYGRIANNIDTIREQLVKWILENSEKTRDEWIEVLPELFAATEFIITPMWSQYAVPNQTIQAGVYSPIVKIPEALSLAKQTCKGAGFTEAWVEENATITGAVYKSLSFVATGSTENTDGVVNFADRFPDYMAVPTTSHDFSRMSTATQGWIMLFQEMLKHAEMLTEYSGVPTGFNRLIRDGVVYLTKDYQGVQYLVVTRHTINKLVAPHIRG